MEKSEGSYHSIPSLHLHVYASHRKRGVSQEVQPTLQHLAVSVRGMNNWREKGNLEQEERCEGQEAHTEAAAAAPAAGSPAARLGMNEKNGTAKED